MKLAILVASISVCAMLVVPRGCALGIPPEEVEVTSSSFGGSRGGFSFSVTWQERGLYFFGGSSSYVTYAEGKEGEPGRTSIQLETAPGCAPLNLDVLPDDLRRGVDVAIALADAALRKEPEESKLVAAAKELLMRVRERKFTIEDASSHGGVSATWSYRYTGDSKAVIINYRDSSASLVMEIAAGAFTLKLREDPTTYSAMVTLAGGKLGAEAANKGGEGRPDERMLLEFLSDSLARAEQVFRIADPEGPADVMEALSLVATTLSGAESFGEYTQLAKTICPT